MERLTERDKCKLENGEEFVLCNHKEEDCNDSCMKVKECRWYKKAMNRLKEYEDLEEQGFLLRLPCKHWMDIVFGEQEVFWGINMDYIENPIREISVESSERFTWYDGWESVVMKGADENGLDWEFLPAEIGKSVFLTMEEAEKELKNRMREEMQWLTWKYGKEWGEIQCPMLGDKYVMTYCSEDEPCYYSYTAPFVQDGEIYYYRFDHDEGCWDESTYCIGEYREGDWG